MPRLVARSLTHKRAQRGRTAQGICPWNRVVAAQDRGLENGGFMYVCNARIAAHEAAPGLLESSDEGNSGYRYGNISQRSDVAPRLQEGKSSSAPPASRKLRLYAVPYPALARSGPVHPAQANLPWETDGSPWSLLFRALSSTTQPRVSPCSPDTSMQARPGLCCLPVCPSFSISLAALTHQRL
jgi:hypothetical protein